VLAPSDRAVSVALVLIELVTNAAKHGYANRVPGPIRVRLERVPDGCLRLSVTDDGQGLPAGFALERSQGLGTRIILALAERLGGHVQANGRDGGAEFAMVMPDPTAAPAY
jgi:two-component sensor histidine kinase